MTDHRLLGRWRASPETAREFGDYAWEFTRFGELIYTVLADQHVISRMLLTYDTAGDVLVTDQPSAPREERSPYEVVGDQLIVGSAVHLRERLDQSSDPDAIFFGIGSAAVNHGLASASGDEPFVPFLMTEVGSTRSLDRLVANTPEEARQYARQLAAARAGASTVAYAYDGYVNVGTERLDAILVEVSHRSRPGGLMLLQPYARSQRAIVRRGGVLNQPCESWFAGPPNPPMQRTGGDDTL